MFTKTCVRARSLAKKVAGWLLHPVQNYRFGKLSVLATKASIVRDYSLALEYVQLALDIHPGDRNMRLLEFEALWSINADEKAQTRAKELTAGFPHDPEILAILGDYYDSRGEAYEGIALSYWEKAFFLSCSQGLTSGAYPDSTIPYAIISRLVRKGEFEKARKVAEAASNLFATEEETSKEMARIIDNIDAGKDLFTPDGTENISEKDYSFLLREIDKRIKEAYPEDELYL